MPMEFTTLADYLPETASPRPLLSPALTAWIEAEWSKPPSVPKRLVCIQAIGGTMGALAGLLSPALGYAFGDMVASQAEPTVREASSIYFATTAGLTMGTLCVVVTLKTFTRLFAGSSPSFKALQQDTTWQARLTQGGTLLFGTLAAIPDTYLAYHELTDKIGKFAYASMLSTAVMVTSKDYYGLNGVYDLIRASCAGRFLAKVCAPKEGQALLTKRHALEDRLASAMAYLPKISHHEVDDLYDRMCDPEGHIDPLSVAEFYFAATVEGARAASVTCPLFALALTVGGVSAYVYYPLAFRATKVWLAAESDVLPTLFAASAYLCRASLMVATSYDVYHSLGQLLYAPCSRLSRGRVAAAKEDRLLADDEAFPAGVPLARRGSSAVALVETPSRLHQMDEVTPGKDSEDAASGRAPASTSCCQVMTLFFLLLLSLSAAGPRTYLAHEYGPRDNFLRILIMIFSGIGGYTLGFWALREVAQARFNQPSQITKLHKLSLFGQKLKAALPHMKPEVVADLHALVRAAP